MIDHVGLNVRDLAAAKAFYAEALEPLGYRVLTELEEHVGFQAGEAGPDFWVSRRGGPGTGTHVCFRARDRETVEAFHTAALAAGGTDNGPLPQAALPRELLRRLRPRPRRQQRRGRLPHPRRPPDAPQVPEYVSGNPSAPERRNEEGTGGEREQARRGAPRRPSEPPALNPGNSEGRARPAPAPLLSCTSAS
jgi:catechol 2,3-dioxygenase-like lactoylglutathione lyase family enzyme